MYDENSKPTREQRGALKTRFPVRVVSENTSLPRKPAWIRAKAPTDPKVLNLKVLLREHNLHTVCEEASCPNLGECFTHGTATFMIMGDLCTRRCPFCDVAHGRPKPLDKSEPDNLAHAIQMMNLKYVVITSVDRDDLKDGGAGHFADCIRAVREKMPHITIEILTPDFRKRAEIALDILKTSPPDVFNHNLETVPRLYREVRPGAVYDGSLQLIKNFKTQHPNVPTKSGLMLGLGETIEEVKEVLIDLRAHDCDWLTIGQYLQPSHHHLPVQRFVHPDEFNELGDYARNIGFKNVASGPMVRSSYHADMQAQGEKVGSIAV
jgi:lipoic acid synthetase